MDQAFDFQPNLIQNEIFPDCIKLFYLYFPIFPGSLDHSDKDGIDEDEELPESMLIYPNPGNDMIKIENSFLDGVFQLFDVSGKNLMNVSLEEGLNNINVQGINSGIYIYLISVNNKQVSSGKWIKR